MQSAVSRNIREMQKENGRKLVSGLTAVKTGSGKNPWMETPEGVLILPAERGGGGARLKDSSARHLPEFYPADPEEAFRMARSAALYADTYRTPILVRLDYEVRFGMAEIGPLRPGKAEKRRGDYSHAASGGLPAAFSDSAWNRVSGSGRRGLIVRGPAALKLQEILNGYPAGRILRLGTPWPFPEERARDFLSGLAEVLVLDEERDRLLNAVYAVKGKYDLRISGGRGGGSLAARATKVEVGGLTQTYRQGLDGTGSKPATSIEFRVNNVASFENLVPNASGEIIVTIVGIDTTSACEAHLGCMFISRVAE